MTRSPRLPLADRPTYQPVLDSAMEDLRGAISRLHGLDTLTTEIVRLRGARLHSCRKCGSLRNVAALRAGGDEAIYDAIDDYERSDLDERHVVALRLTDAVVTQPAQIDDGLAADLQRLYTPAQIVEMVLDVMSNSSQKVSVTLGFDEARVTEGTELYEVLADGTRVFPGRERV